MTLRLLAVPLVAVTLLAMPVAAQDRRRRRRRKPRVSPPQPQQAQGVDYFTGAWTFTWVGRESPISAGPREGTLTDARGAQTDWNCAPKERSTAARRSPKPAPRSGMPRQKR